MVSSGMSNWLYSTNLTIARLHTICCNWLENMPRYLYNSLGLINSFNSAMTGVTVALLDDTTSLHMILAERMKEIRDISLTILNLCMYSLYRSCRLSSWMSTRFTYLANRVIHSSNYTFYRLSDLFLLLQVSTNGAEYTIEAHLEGKFVNGHA